ncbi:MAG: beta-eliminating lyase-related protein, partial [Bacteroidota bacterium]
GSYYHLDEVRAIRAECDKLDLRLHLDGARFFNALTETEDLPSDHGRLFDTISVCFSKGLGAPVGSALVGTAADIKQAKRVRKALGGGMRQAGYLAAACIYALEHHIERLTEDHIRARSIGEMAAALPFVRRVYPVRTNIIIVELDNRSETWMLDELKKHGVLAVGFGPGLVRFVTHLDFTDDHLHQLEEVFKQMASA